MSGKYVILLDPSLIDNNGTPSTNIGDLIIYDAVSKIIESLFPGLEIIRISTHQFPKQKHIDLIRNASYTIIGGTNLLSSHIRQYNQWKTYTSFMDYLFPKINNIILLGVGWWQYQGKPDFVSKRFYRKVLHDSFIHSVRDSYTLNKLKLTGMDNCINTSCPTLWGLDGKNINHKNLGINNCLFTLTDYYPNIEFDNNMIELILDNFTGEIFFFPQGTEDVAYINSLAQYQKNAGRITILQRDLQTFHDVLKHDICYVGTRLHAGIKCIENSVESLILSVDNRAAEIAADVNLPVAERSDINKISDWMCGKVDFENINLPIENINKWKSQFEKSYETS